MTQFARMLIAVFEHNVFVEVGIAKINSLEYRLTGSESWQADFKNYRNGNYIRSWNENDRISHERKSSSRVKCPLGLKF